MTTALLARKVLHAEYTLLRTPLTVVERQLLTRCFADDSRVRVSAERALGSLDATAGRLLADPELVLRGQALRQRPASHEDGAEVDGQAERLPAQGREIEQAGTADAERRQQERERVAEALLSEQDEKRHVGELARASGAEKERQAELRAKHRVEELEAERQAKQARIDENVRPAASAKRGVKPVVDAPPAAPRRRAAATKPAGQAARRAQPRQ